MGVYIVLFWPEHPLLLYSALVVHVSRESIIQGIYDGLDCSKKGRLLCFSVLTPCPTAHSLTAIDRTLRLQEHTWDPMLRAPLTASMHSIILLPLGKSP